jgi:hypothetical protein
MRITAPFAQVSPSIRGPIRSPYPRNQRTCNLSHGLPFSVRIETPQIRTASGLGEDLRVRCEAMPNGWT